MKKVIERLNRVLAILLVAAMVVGSVPEMSLVARAEGTTDDGATSDDDATTGDVGSDGTTLGEAEAQGLDTPDADPADQATPSGEQSEPGDKTEATVSSGDAQDTTTPATPSGPFDVTCTIDGKEALENDKVKIVSMPEVKRTKVAENAQIVMTVEVTKGYTISVTSKINGAAAAVTTNTANQQYTLAKATGKVEISITTTPIEVAFDTTASGVTGSSAGDGSGISLVNANETLNVAKDGLEFIVDAGENKAIGVVSATYGSSGTALTTTKVSDYAGENGRRAKWKIAGSELNNVTFVDGTKIIVTATTVAASTATKVTLTNVTGQWKLSGADDSTKRALVSGVNTLSVPAGKTAELYLTANPGYTLPSSGTNVSVSGNKYTITATGAAVVGDKIEYTIVRGTNAKISAKEITITNITATPSANIENDTSKIDWGKDFTFTVKATSPHKLVLGTDGKPDVTAKIGTDANLAKLVGENSGVYTYIIKGDDLKGTSSQSLTIEADSYKAKPTVTFSANDFVKDEVKYKAKAGTVSDVATECTTVATNGAEITVVGDEKLYFKVTLKTDETRTPKINGNAMAQVGSTKVYTYTVDYTDSSATNIADDYVITLEGGATGGTSQKITETLNGATISYKDGCMQVVGSDHKTRPGVDLKFSLTAKTETGKVYEITNVKSTINNVDKVLWPVNGVYTIEATEFASNPPKITVTHGLVGSTGDKYKVTFQEITEVGANQGSQTVIVKDSAGNKLGSGAATLTTDKLEVAKNGTNPVNAVFTVEPGANMRVLYVSTSSGKITPAADKKYTVPITHDTTIYVATESTTITANLYKRPAQTNGTDNATSVTAVSAVGAQGNLTFNSNTPPEASITKKGDVTLTITPAQNYKVTGVKYGDYAASGEILNKDAIKESENKYVLEDVAGATSFAVQTMLDDTSTNVSKVVFTGKSSFVVVDVKDGGTTHTGITGNEYLTTGTGELEITVKPATSSNYEITKITKDNGADDVKGTTVGSGAYTVKVKPSEATGKKITLNITAEPASDSSAKTVTVTTVGDRVSYKITNAAGEYVKNSDGTYTLMSGVRSLKFDVDVMKGTPDVTLTVGANAAAAITGTQKAGTTVYSYEIPAKTLDSTSNTVTVGAQVETAYFKIKSTEDTSIASVDYIINGVKKSITGTSLATTPKTLVAEVGDKIEIVANPADNCGVKLITITQGATTSTNEKDRDQARCEFTAAAMNEIEITPEKLQRLVIMNDNSGNVNASSIVSPAADGKYYLTAGKTYHANVKNGADATPVTMNGSEVKILDKNGKETGAAETAGTYQSTGSPVTVKFTISTYDGGKTLRLKLKNGSTEIKSADIVVSPVANEIKVNGRKNAEIEVEAGRETYVKYVTTPKDASAIKGASDSGITVARDSATELKITAPGTVGTVGNISLLDAATDTPLIGGDLTITTKPIAALVNAKPSLKQIAATDANLYIEATTPKLPELASGNYIMIVDLYDTASTPTLKNTAYVKWENDVTKKNFIVTVTEAAGTTYNVEAMLVYSATDLSSSVPATKPTSFIMQGKSSAKVKMSTRTADKYETNLGAKVTNGRVYTGQADVEIAVPVFGKNTSVVKIVKVEDVTTKAGISKFDTTEEEEDGTSVRSGDFDIDDYASVTITKTIKLKNVSPDKIGSHTIKLWAAGDSDTLGASKTITVNVLKGIEDVKLSAPGDGMVYKAAKKTATLTVKPTFNDGGTQPSKKTLTWTVLKVNANGTVGDPYDTKTGNIKVSSSGRVTIAANTPDGEKFCVRAVANDYTGDAMTIFDGARTAEIVMEVTEEKLEFGDIVIVDGSGNELARSGGTVAADALGGARVAALHKGVERKNKYGAGDMVSAESMTFKSGNAGVLAVDAQGNATVKKAGANISVTVTANDGSKTTAKIEKLTIVRPAANPGLRIRGAASQVDEFVAATKATPVEYSANGSTYIDLDLATGPADADIIDKANTGWYKYTIGVKGAAIVEKAAGSNQPCKIMPNAETTTITFTDSERKDSSGKKFTFTYTLKNTAWAGNLKEKAPKIAINGTLTAGTPVAANKDAQKCVRSVTLTAAQGSYTYAYVAFDGADYNRNAARYDKLNAAIAEDLKAGTLKELANNAFTLNFNNNEILKGNYKLTVTYMKKDGENFVPVCKAATVTVAAKDPAAAKFSPAGTYRMSTLDATSVRLAGTATAGVKTAICTDIQNKNKDGSANDFTGIFELGGTWPNQTLNIKSGDIAAKIAEKDNLKGYLVYEVTDIMGYTTTLTKEISVTLVTGTRGIGGLTIPAVKVAEGATTAQMKVMRGGAEVELAYGSVSVKGSPAMTASLGPDNKTITLTLKDSKTFAKGQTYKPEVSFRTKGGILTSRADVTITVEGIAAAKDKITIAKTTVDMTDAASGVAFAGDKQDGTMGDYTVTVPYVCAKGVDATSFSVNGTSDIEVAKAATGHGIVLKLNRSKVTAANAGKTYQLKVDAKFNADGTIKETLTLNVKYPAYVKTFKEITDEVAEYADALEIYNPETNSSNQGNLTNPALTAVKTLLIKLGAQGTLNANAYNTADNTGSYSNSEVGVVVAHSTATGKTANAVATSTTDGAAYIAATFTDKTAATGATGSVVVVEFAVRVIKIGSATTRAGAIAQKIVDFKGKANNYTNSTTVADVRKELETYIGLKANEALYVENSVKVNATDSTPGTGRIDFRVVIKDAVTNTPIYTSHASNLGDSTNPGVSVVIAKLQDTTTAKGEIDSLISASASSVNAWTKMARTLTTSSNVATEVKKCVQTVVTNPDIVITVVPKGTSNTFFKTEGNPAVTKALFTIELTNPNSAVDRNAKKTVYKTSSSTDPIEVAITDVRDMAAVEKAIKDEFAKTNSVAGSIAKQINESNDKEAIKGYIEELIAKEVGNSGVTGTLTTYNFTRALYSGQKVYTERNDADKLKGKVEYTITLTKTGQTAKTITGSVEIAAADKWQTMTDLEVEIEKALEAGKATIAETSSDKGEAKALALITAVNKNSYTVVISTELPDTDSFGNPPKIISYTAPTGSTKGEFKARFKISKTVSNVTTKHITKEITVEQPNIVYDLKKTAAGADNKDAATKAVQDAVEAQVKLTNEDNTAKGLEDKTKEIIKVAKSVLEPEGETKFTVKVKSGKELKITAEATKSDAATLGEMILEVTDDAATPNKIEVSLSGKLKITALDLTNQTIDDAAYVAEEVLKRWMTTGVTEAEMAGETAAKASIKAKVEGVVNIAAGAYTVDLAPAFGSEGIDLTKATVKAKGKVTFTVCITKGTESRKVKITEMPINLKSQTLAEVQAAVKADDIKAAVGATLTAADTNDGIKKKAEDYVKGLVNTDQYDVNGTVTRTEGQTTGSVKVTIMDKKNNSNKHEPTATWS